MALYQQSSLAAPSESYARSAEDHIVWQLLFQRQIHVIRAFAHPDIVRGLEAFGLDETLPDIAALSETMHDRVGWRMCLVRDQISAQDFVACLRDRTLPTTGHIRGRDELAHSRSPDAFHDIFGHVPLLADADYRRFLEAYADHPVFDDPAPEIIDRLGTAFKWIVEYGLTVHDGMVCVVGAGLLSSSKELAHALDPGTRRLAFDPASIVDTLHVPAQLQPAYFVLPDFSSLCDAVPEIVDAAIFATARS